MRDPESLRKSSRDCVRVVGLQGWQRVACAFSQTETSVSPSLRGPPLSRNTACNLNSRHSQVPSATAKKSKGAKTPPAPPAQPAAESRSSRVRRWFFRPAPLITAATLVSMFVMAPYIPHLLPDLTQLEEYQFECERIEVNAPHEWVPGTLLEDVLVRSSLPRRISLLQSGICRDIAAAFLDHPWIKDVQAVRLTNQRTVRTVLIYRVPVAFVRTHEGLIPVDADGVVLPSADFTMADIDRLPHIENVQSLPTGRAGEPWGDAVVEAASKIAAALVPAGDMDKYWKRFDLTAIVAPDVLSSPAHAEQLSFELSTSGGSRIIWGKAPGADDLEPTVEQKLGRLEQYLSRFGKFDEPNGPYRIDIRLFDAISLEPLSTLRYR